MRSIESIYRTFSFLLIWSTFLDNKKYRVVFLVNVNNNQQVTNQAANRIAEAAEAATLTTEEGTLLSWAWDSGGTSTWQPRNNMSPLPSQHLHKSHFIITWPKNNDQGSVLDNSGRKGEAHSTEEEHLVLASHSAPSYINVLHVHQYTLSSLQLTQTGLHASG